MRRATILVAILAFVPLASAMAQVRPGERVRLPGFGQWERQPREFCGNQLNCGIPLRLDGAALQVAVPPVPIALERTEIHHEFRFGRDNLAVFIQHQGTREVVGGPYRIAGKFEAGDSLSDAVSRFVTL